MECIVEVFGVPRQILKASEVKLDLHPGATLREVVAELGRTEEELMGRVIVPDTSSLIPPYMLYQDGRGFVEDLSHKVEPGDRFVLMMATVGG